MATLAFNREEISPRQLKPALLELDGTSREAVEAHFKLVGARAPAYSRGVIEAPA